MFIECFHHLQKLKLPRYAAMFILILDCLISDGCDFRVSEIRNLVLYSLSASFILRWPITDERNGHRFHVNCSAGFKVQENGFPERHICASAALDKQSNLKCNPNLFSSYKDIT
jgi:hypothetical protein